MGEEADRILEYLFDRVHEFDDDDGFPAGTQAKKCKFCGAENLFWDVDHHDVTGKWRLREAGGPPWVVHRCVKENDIPPLED